MAIRHKAKVLCSAINQFGDPCRREVEQVGDLCGAHDPNRRRCKHKYATGEVCDALPLAGHETCIVHGGRSLSAQKAAKSRLLAAVAPALNTLERAMECADWPTAVRAALGILDRAGFGPMTKVTVDGVSTSEFKELTNNELQERASMVLRRIQERKEQLALKQLTVEAVSAERTNENPRPDTPDEDSSNAVH